MKFFLSFVIIFFACSCYSQVEQKDGVYSITVSLNGVDNSATEMGEMRIPFPEDVPNLIDEGFLFTRKDELIIQIEKPKSRWKKTIEYYAYLDRINLKNVGEVNINEKQKIKLIKSGNNQFQTITITLNQAKEDDLFKQLNVE